ncbi:MAG: YqgE/AlgH family protein [Candidatus Nanopelagicales bacterium]
MNDGYLTGCLLVASPTLGDTNFDRSVILLVDHDESGALGVIINRPSTIDVGSILPEWHVYSTTPPVVFHGGPVGRDSALALAALAAGPAFDESAEPEGFRRVFGPLGLVDLDAEPERMAGEISTLRVFAGYAGWEPDQLEQEIKQGAWFVVDSTDADPFQPDPQDLWAQVLRRQGGELALVATFPEDPTLN